MLGRLIQKPFKQRMKNCGTEKKREGSPLFKAGKTATELCWGFFVSVSDANVVCATRHTMAMHLEYYINLTVERHSFAAV